MKEVKKIKSKLANIRGSLFNQYSDKKSTNDIKSRFFAQYFGQNILGFVGNQIDYKVYPHVLTKNKNWSNRTQNIENQFIVLKSLSKITNEDAEKLQYTLVNVIGLDGLIKQNSIDLVKEVVSNYEKVDCLFMLPSSFADLARELGYAIDWNNYKVSEQIKLGWIKLI
jgi:hypothetical protein